MGERYINPYTDFGFKKLFGTELNKELLISFLNALFEEGEEETQGVKYDKIVDLTYLNGEQLGRSATERRAIFDVYCETESGSRFIVEMQNVFQQFFKDRSVYYSSFPIRDMAKRGSDGQEAWSYELQKVYMVGILNFVFSDSRKGDDAIRHDVMLMDVKTKEVFYDKLVYVYLEMPKFKKKREELVTMYDKWLFVLKNLSRLMERPPELQERVFTRLFEQAEIAKFSKTEYSNYEDSLRGYWDLTNAMGDAKKEGVEEGIVIGEERGMKKGIEQGKKDGKREDARIMKQKGLSIELIAEITGLPLSEIEEL